MYCKKCGMQVDESNRFCPTCGNDLTKDTFDEKEDDFFTKYDKENGYATKEESANRENMAYKVFAIIGYVAGIISICLCWIPWMFNFSIPGMVFSKIGQKSENKKMQAKKGFILSLIATIISVIMTIIVLVIVINYAKDHPDANIIFDFDFD